MNPIERLRAVLGVNALVSGLAGLVAAIASEPVADATWSAAAVAVALSATLSPAGVAIVLATGVMTAEFAYLEWTAVARASRAAPATAEVAA